MGGKEASRGFLYQAFTAVLEALCDEKWDKIYVEYTSNDDKVDIALEENGKISKSIQVKSTINSFSKPSIINWLKALNLKRRNTKQSTTSFVYKLLNA